eukprot:UN22480
MFHSFFFLHITHYPFYIFKQGTLKIETSERTKTIFFTMPGPTKNTLFERSTANLRNLIVALLIDASQFNVKLKL